MKYSYSPNLQDCILVIAPLYTANMKSVVYTLTRDNTICRHLTCLETTSFVEHFLYLQGTSIEGSRKSARKLHNLTKNIPIYAPITKQVIHKYKAVAAPDPIYFFTMYYNVKEIAKKRCELSLASLSFTVEASKKQCLNRQKEAAHFLWLKSAPSFLLHT